MDYLKIPFFDNHSHPIDEQHVNLTPGQFAMVWLHGFRDLPDGSASEELVSNVKNLGAVYAMVHQLAGFYGCEETLEAVTAERNRRTEKLGLAGYAEQLYTDGGVFCTLIDSDLAWGDPKLNLFPGKIIRHIQMDPIFFSLLKEKNCFADLKAAFIQEIKDRVAKGYVSIKAHPGELFTLDLRYVSDGEGELKFRDAQAGDKAAQRLLYYAIFHQAMLTAKELDIPIHIHTGITGGYWDGGMNDCDPYMMGPFLRNVPHMQETKLVLLHSNYPSIGKAAMMAHAFPNVYVDLAWVLPWIALDFDRCLQDLLEIAPSSKILLGSGQHNIPEIAWMSSMIARRSLKHVMNHLVESDIVSEKQAFTMAEQIMYKNACKMYGIPEP